jgi:hypothetical protein
MGIATGSGNGRQVNDVLFMYKENESYEGKFNNDKKQGEGIYRWKLLRQVYQGEFRNDLRYPIISNFEGMVMGDLSIKMGWPLKGSGLMTA